MTQMAQKELSNYFNEHVLYELLMLRFARRRMNSTNQLIWNSMFAVFNISARNLYCFLNNKRKNTDMRLLDYKKYVGNFTRGDISVITGTLQMLNEQCFHLGKNRPHNEEKKVKLERIDLINQWIEENMKRLFESFDADFMSHINLERADPDALCNRGLEQVRGPTGPTSSSFPQTL